MIQPMHLRAHVDGNRQRRVTDVDPYHGAGDESATGGGARDRTTGEPALPTYLDLASFCELGHP